jgi:hypothetical protein
MVSLSRPQSQLSTALADQTGKTVRLRPEIPIIGSLSLLENAQSGPSQQQQANETLGPFTDELGVPFFLDIITQATLTQISWAGQTQPFILLSQPAPPVGNVSSITLGAGTIWMLASEFASLGSSTPGYIGMQVSGGTIGLGNATSTTSGSITVPVTSSVFVSLQLVQVSTPGSTANFQVSIPPFASFSFTNQNARLNGAGHSTFSAFGNSIGLTFLSQPAVFRSDLNTLQFPFQANNSQLTLSNQPASTPLASFSGKVSITSAFWSLPIDSTPFESLGLVVGAGGMGLNLGTELLAKVPQPVGEFDPGSSTLVVMPDSLSLRGDSGSTITASQIIKFWDGAFATLSFPELLTWIYTCQSNETQAWGFLTPMSGCSNSPRTINNDTVNILGNGVFALQQPLNGQITVRLIVGKSNARELAVSYSLKNLLLRADPPAAFSFIGNPSSQGFSGGTLAVSSNLIGSVPILPDPYATNVDFSPGAMKGTESIGTLVFTLTWANTSPPISPTLSVKIPNTALERLRVRAPNYKESTGLDRADGLPDIVKNMARPSKFLLDLSTNVSQFGVAFNTGNPDMPSIPSLSVSTDFSAQISGNLISIVTLPPMQWEPLQDFASGKTLSYLDSGPTSVINVNSVALVPVTPRAAIDSMLNTYHSTQVSSVSIRFGLPFAIVAFAQLSKPAFPVTPVPGINQVQPNFQDSNMSGGDQISFRAARSRLISPLPSRSPSFSGFTNQFLTALTDGQNIGDSAIGMSVDGTSHFNTDFNDKFGSATTPFVPVVRYDLSGFGASTFSAWQDPNAKPATVSKATFHATNGRCSLEVVQVFSVILPYAIRVVRTVTIERKSDSTLIRKDSGWQAGSDGNYSTQAYYPSIQTHPGVIESVSSVVNIREVLGADVQLKTAAGVVMRPVTFDCAATVENVQTGQGTLGVPALNQMGYLQIEGDSNNFGPAGYAELLGQVGPLGGIVDCTIDIGSTGLGMHVVRVGVASSKPANGDPQFSMAAWGTVALPKVGQWTFVRTISDRITSTAVDERLGVPLIRQGLAGVTSTSPYRFADPSDLLPPSPETDYGIVFSTGYQRVLFSRPKIEDDGKNQITSEIPPWIADVYALGMNTGPFPQIINCVPFRKDIPYALSILANDGLKLSPSGQYKLDPFQRVLMISNNSSSIARIGNEATTDGDGNPVAAVQGTVELSIDTTNTATPWTINLFKTSYSTNDTNDGEIMRISSDIIHDSTKDAPQFANSAHTFGPGAAAAAKLLSFLSVLGPLPPLDTNMTNSWEFQAGCYVNKETLGKFYGPLVQQFIESFCDDIEVKILMIVAFDVQLLAVEIEVDFHIGSPQGPGWFVEVIAGGGFKSSNKDGDAYMAKFGFGVGYQTKIATFKAQAHCDLIGQYIKLPQGFDVGGSVRIQAEIDFAIVRASATVEGGIRYRQMTCTFQVS